MLFKKSLLIIATGLTLTASGLFAATAVGAQPQTAKSTEQAANKACIVCNKKTSSSCPTCGTSYCSEKCQLKDWPLHQPICADTKARIKSLEGFAQRISLPNYSRLKLGSKELDLRRLALLQSHVIHDPKISPTNKANVITEAFTNPLATHQRFLILISSSPECPSSPMTPRKIKSSLLKQPLAQLPIPSKIIQRELQPIRRRNPYGDRDIDPLRDNPPVRRSLAPDSDAAVKD